MGPGRAVAPDGVGPRHGQVQPQTTTTDTTTMANQIQMQTEGLDRVNGVPLGPRLPLSPRDSYRGSSVVQNSSYLAVPLGSGPGYGRDAVRTGGVGGGAGRVVDDDGSACGNSSASSNGSENGSEMGEGDRPISMTSISSPPAPQPRGSLSLPYTLAHIRVRVCQWVLRNSERMERSPSSSPLPAVVGCFS
jgi:hypothetical protein